MLSGFEAVQDDQFVILDGLLLGSSGPLGVSVAVDAVFDQLEAVWAP